jgi:dihydrofolate reductase
VTEVSMKVFFVVALTVDGYIAKNPHHLVNWTSIEDKQFVHELVQRAGVVVVGLNTYNTFGKPFPNATTIVYSTSEKNISGVEVTQDNPEKLIENLATRGFKEVAILGGAQIYTLFMPFAHTLYITTESQVWGTGMSLFTKGADYRLIRESVKELSDTSLLVEYTVIHGKKLV